jgi:hypothetical protein
VAASVPWRKPKPKPAQTFYNFVRQVTFDALSDRAKLAAAGPVDILGFVNLPLSESLRGIPAWSTSFLQHPHLSAALCGVSETTMESIPSATVQPDATNNRGALAARDRGALAARETFMDRWWKRIDRCNDGKGCYNDAFNPRVFDIITSVNMAKNSALRQPLRMLTIIGPPGTGKTWTNAMFIQDLRKFAIEIGEDFKTLCVAHSNVAVIAMYEECKKMAEIHGDVDTFVKDCVFVDGTKGAPDEVLKLSLTGQSTDQWSTHFNSRKCVHVFCTTSRAKIIQFPWFSVWEVWRGAFRLIAEDEGGQQLAIDAMHLPAFLSHDGTHAVYGDPRQLAPHTLQGGKTNTPLSNALVHAPYHLLTEQRRQCQVLGDINSVIFYEGSVKNAPSKLLPKTMPILLATWSDVRRDYDHLESDYPAEPEARFALALTRQLLRYHHSL